MWDGASEDCTGALRNERGASALVRLRRPSRQSTHVHTSPARETRESHNAVVVTRQRGGESHTGKRRDLTVVSFRHCVNVASFLTYVRQNGHTYTRARIARLPMTVD